MLQFHEINILNFLIKICSAPDVLVVSTEAGSGNEVTIETSAKPRALLASVPHDILLGRWRLTLDLFGRVFVNDVGLETGSIISELGGFPVKEAKFKREMEKLRNSKTVDLVLSKLDRDRNNLIVQAFKVCNLSNKLVPKTPSITG